ncbi:MAG: O-methyltransferase [Opitutaceae bacterium]
MSQETWSSVDHYFSRALAPSDAVLDAALQASEAAGLPSIHVSPLQGKLLMLLAQAHGSRSILEIGTLGGYSTIWLARALPAGGRLITLESEARHAAVARENIARAGFAGVVEVRVGRAIETLPALEAEQEGPFDFIFLDADKASYPDYLTWALRLSRPGTVIVADNVVRNGQVIDPASPDVNVQGVRRLTEQMAAEPRLSSTVIQTVGSKGYDGFAFAIVCS